MMEGTFGPPINRAMRRLDRDFFKRDVPLAVAYFPNPRYLGDFVKACKEDVLYLPSVKHIVPIENSKGVLLRQEVSPQNFERVLSPTTFSKIQEYHVQIRPHTLHLDYSFWKADDILRAVLPENLLEEVPTGFAQAGHVAHFNLREEFKPYGNLIGEVILDKNPNIETVVDKVDTIDTVFRTFQMNVLAGKKDLVVEQSESGCKFRFDFSKVYWNLRLSTEHDRLVKQFTPHDVVADVFAGVGPFAVPAAKKNVLVLGNDLNPESYKYLKENIAINHVGDFVKPYNLDGREFIRQSPHLVHEWATTTKTVEKKKVTKRRKLDPATNQRVSVKDTEITRVHIPRFISDYVMNLPDLALTFLDEFIGLYKDVPDIREVPGFRLPLIHVHCFEKFSSDEPEPSMEELHRRVHKRIETILNSTIPFEEFSFHLVRKVAPTKPMFCVTFQLPEAIAFRN